MTTRTTRYYIKIGDGWLWGENRLGAITHNLRQDCPSWTDADVDKAHTIALKYGGHVVAEHTDISLRYQPPPVRAGVLYFVQGGSQGASA